MKLNAVAVARAATALQLLAVTSLALGQTQTTTSRTYHPGTTLVASQTVDGVTWSFTYHPSGEIASITDPRGVVTTFANYKLGIPQLEVRAAGRPEEIRVSRVVSALGCITEETDGEGHRTTFSRDSLCRPTGISPPKVGSNATTVTYFNATATSRQSRVTTRGALTETTEYDGFGRELQKTAGGVKVSWRYDAAGRLAVRANPTDASDLSIVGDSFTYDGLGRTIRVSHADGTFKLMTYGAGASGRPTVVETDERGMQTTKTFRAFGDPATQELIGVSPPVAGSAVSMTRNVRGQLLSATLGAQTRTYNYDSRYYLVSTVDPEIGTTVFGRDASGNMTSRTVGSGGASTYTYDGHGRLTLANFPSGAPSITYSYNKVGRMTSAQSTGGVRTMTYDPNRNLVADTLTLDGYSMVTSFGYNGNDQLTTQTYPLSGRVIQFSPDRLGRPTQVSPFITSATYWPSGQPRQISYANGVVSTYGQNSRLWPSSFAVSRPGIGTFAQSSYTFDGVGNLTGVSDAVDSSFNRSVAYDAMNRVSSASGSWGAGLIQYSPSNDITYQQIGASSLTYSYAGNGRLQSVSGARNLTFVYDRFGNVTANSVDSFVYDGVPQLRAITTAGNRTDYFYDGKGARSKVVRNGVASYEVYDDRGRALLEYTPSSGRVVEYFYLGVMRIAEYTSP